MVDGLTVRFKGAPRGCCCWASSPSLRMNSLPPLMLVIKIPIIFARRRWRCLILEGGRWVLKKKSDMSRECLGRRVWGLEKIGLRAVTTRI